MSIVGKTIKSGKVVQDNRKEWLKIDGVCLGETSKFGYSSTSSKDIGAILDKMLKDEKVVAVVYNWKTGQAFMKTGIDIDNNEDSKINQDYTTFIVSSKVKSSTPSKPTVSQPLTNVPSGFLTRNGENLSLDGKNFISVGSNAYWLGYTEGYGYPSKPQVEEMFIAVTRLGGNTIRSHTLGHSSGSSDSLRPYDNNLNENAWDSIDYAFSMARKYNVKIIAPLTDGYSWYNGNYGHFCAPRGVDKKEFWTNKQVRDDFKDYINKYLNHYNPYNKCFIKDDPSLGMIELGNELGNIREGANSYTIPTYDWLLDISNYVRSIDKNHLILNPADESLGQSNEMGIENLDCHGAHFYWEDYNRLDHGINIVRQAGKPYIVGEYSSFANEKWYRDLESRNVKASWFWSMYPHSNGIFGGDKIPHEDGYTIHYSEDNKKHLLLIAQHFCRLKGVPEVTDLDFGKYVPTIEPIKQVQPDKPTNNNWENNKTYKEGQVVIHKEISYKCVKSHSSSIEPDEVIWQKIDTKPTLVPEVKPNPEVKPTPVQPNPEVKPSSGEWKDGKFYKKNDVVTYKNKLYTCIQEHTSNMGWLPDVTKLILWNEIGVSVQQPTPVPEVKQVPIQPTPGPEVKPTPDPIQPVGQNIPITGGRLHRLLNGKSPIGTYYQSWSAPWASTGEAHDLSKISSPINIVYISFCSADSGYIKGSNSFAGTGIQFSSEFGVIKKAVEILRKRGVIVMLSVGGATYPFTTYNAKNVADLCNDLGCNGVDIDWEDEHGFERFGSLISSTREALPNGCISTAGFSVGAYGEGNFASSPPASSRTGMNIQGLKSNGHQLDWINIMSYDASNVFNPIESFKAYRSFYKGPLLIGGEVPPEAWGGHVIDLDQVKKEAEFLKSQGPENGYFTWSYQKQGTPNSKEILDTAFGILKNQIPLANKPAVTGEQDTVVKNPVVVPLPIQKGKTILAPYCYSWSKWHRSSYKIPTLVDGIKTISMSAATFAFVTSDGGNNLSATVQENIEDMVEYVKLGGHLIISCGGASSPWIEATMSVERMVELLGNLFIKTGAKGIDLDVEGTALHNTEHINNLNKAVAQLQKKIPGLYVSYTIPVGDPQWESIEGPSQNLLKNAIENGVSINVVNLMLMDLYGDYSKRPLWGQLAINISENAKKTLTKIFPSRSESQIYNTIGLCPMLGTQDDLSIFSVEDAKTLARYAKEKNVGLYSFWAIQRDQIGNTDLNLHSKINKVDFEFYNTIKSILYS
jgi:mannan endo-1,4-beta-mannosidase